MKTPETERKPTNANLINISKKTFLSVVVLLFALIVFAIVLTYVLPKGTFGVDAEGNVDYTEYILLENESGINVFKGLFSPVLNLFSSDGLTVIMLSLFLVIISGAFQVMNDVNGIRSFVNLAVDKFRHKKFLLLAIVSFVFMSFGAFLGLFEEMLTLLPIMVILTVSLGYDSFTGFLVSIVACGFGFSAAVTNPFTVLFASDIIGVDPMVNVWYRIVIFLFFYALLLLYLLHYTKKIARVPEKSLTYERDLKLKGQLFEDAPVENEKTIRRAYSVFFALILAVIITCSALSALRDYSVVFLIVVFLIGGILCGLFATNFRFRRVFASFGRGALSALPSVALILLAASIKYILVEGKILPTVSNYINGLASTQNVYLVALILYAIVLVLEFFISSSTAKAVFVMSILGTVTLGLNKEMLVLIYTFADGFTNLLFPTSPVLLIGLSMIEVSYFKWLKKSWPLFAVTALSVAAFLALGIWIGY